MSKVSKAGSRSGELYGSDALTFGGGIIAAAAVMFYVGNGSINHIMVMSSGAVFWIWLTGCMIMAWNQGSAPFCWIRSNVINLLLIVCAPVTLVLILIGCLGAIAGLPFLMWRDAQKKYNKELRQREAGNKYITPYKPHSRAYLAFGFLYYPCIAGVGLYIWLSVIPH